MTQCAACHRVALADSRYCEYHKKACDIMTNHYKKWIDAYGSISWQDYLNKLSKMKETGIWVKEVIAGELNKSEG